MLGNGDGTIRARLAVLVAVAPLALAAACGTSGGTSEGADDPAPAETSEAPATDDTTTTTTEASDAVDVETWADDFCGGFAAWLDGIEAASNSVGDGVTRGDIESGKTAIADLFGEASAETQTLISTLQDAGYPDITDGDQLSEELIERFESFDAAAQAAQAEAEALTTTDAAEFQTQAEELTDRFESEVSEVADSFAQIDVDYPSAELTVAINGACDF